MTIERNARLAPARRLWNWLTPGTVQRRVVGFAWLNLALQIAIVGTGGLVRLTGSGLGCPNWPLCTPESLIPTGELGIHGAIEFGNRLMTGVLLIVGLLLLLGVWRLHGTQFKVRTLTIVTAGLVVLQAVWGGVLVWLQLPPYLVGGHFFISAGLVGISALIVWNITHPFAKRVRVAAAPVVALAHTMSFALLITVVLGILTTGAGPHAGDDVAARNGLSTEVMNHVHAGGAYALLGVTAALVVAALITRSRATLRLSLLLLATEGVQAGVGVVQANTGLPVALVFVHMLLAVITVAIGAWVIMSLKAAAPEDAPRVSSSAASDTKASPRERSARPHPTAEVRVSAPRASGAKGAGAR